MTSGDDFRGEMVQRHAALQASVQGDALFAVLHIGATESAVAVGRAGGETQIVRFLLGYAGVPASLFSRDIPTALELENAIAVVEDEVMPAVRQLRGVTALVTADPELHVLASAASVDPHGALSLDRVEWLFDELTRAALGGPASGLPFAPTKQLAAALLILREFMHHGGIRALRCLRLPA